MKLTPLLPLALAACQTLPADPAKMTAEQLTAYAKDRNASVACVSGKTMAGNITTTYVVLDKGVVVNGAVTVDNECRVSLGTSAKPASAP